MLFFFMIITNRAKRSVTFNPKCFQFFFSRISKFVKFIFRFNLHRKIFWFKSRLQNINNAVTNGCLQRIVSSIFCSSKANDCIKMLSPDSRTFVTDVKHYWPFHLESSTAIRLPCFANKIKINTV